VLGAVSLRLAYKTEKVKGSEQSWPEETQGNRALMRRKSLEAEPPREFHAAAIT